MYFLLYDTGEIRNEYNEPLGIEVIAGSIKSAYPECETKLLWYNRDGIPTLELLRQCFCVGISLHILQLDIFDKIYKLMRTCNNKIFIFVGNTVSTYGYEKLLELYPDIICSIGEGEETYYYFLEKYYEKKGALVSSDLQVVPNLAYNHKGRVIITERKVANLEKYATPVRPFLDFLKNRKGVARLEGSRGCSWNRCSFCNVPYKYDYKMWRAIPIDLVIQQIVELSQYGIYSIYFTDEDFFGDDCLRVENLITEVKIKKKNGLIDERTNFFISVKPADILDETTYKIIEKFIQIGLREVFIGLESGCSEQLKRYVKCTTKEKNIKVLQRLKALELDIDIGYIFFDPEMSINDIKESIEFIENYELYKYGANFIKRLRLQPYAALTHRLISKEKYVLDLQNLEYKYRFRDCLVQQIFEKYDELNIEYFALQIQGFYRGEEKEEDNYILSRTYLVKLRKLQIKALKAILHNIIEGDEEWNGMVWDEAGLKLYNEYLAMQNSN